MAGHIRERVKCMYLSRYQKNPVLTLFLTVLSCGLIIFIIAGVLTGGESIYCIFHSDHNDTFMDYFNSIMYSADHPYTVWTVMYPPLITLFYTLIGNFTIPFVNVEEGETLAFALRDSQMGMMSFLVITLLSFFVLNWVFKKMLENTDIRIEPLFLLLLLSFPFIFAIERGNAIIITLLFCFIFLMFYRSENKILRYISFIALGAAAGFKLYPAIMWLLVLREGNRKESIICFLIVTALVLVPFIFTDGNILMVAETIFTYTESNYGVTNINQMIRKFFGFLGLEGGYVSTISYLVVGTFTLLTFIVIIFDKKMKFWKTVALLVANLILGFGVGTQYQMIYMTLPILYFLTSEKEMSRVNLFYVICLAMTMVLLPGIEVFGIYPSLLIGAIESGFVIILSIVLLYEGLTRIWHTRRESGTTQYSSTG